jgi:hypothetical protein
MPAFTEPQKQDRRSKRRFLIEQDVQYQRLQGTKVLDSGIGKTVDMSSSAIRFTTGLALQQGDKVKIAVNWPVLLDATCRLNMVIYGWVLRSDGNTAAVTIGHHELRTRAAGQAQPLTSLTGPGQSAAL